MEDKIKKKYKYCQGKEIKNMMDRERKLDSGDGKEKRIQIQSERGKEIKMEKNGQELGKD